MTRVYKPYGALRRSGERLKQQAEAYCREHGHDFYDGPPRRYEDGKRCRRCGFARPVEDAKLPSQPPSEG